MKTVLIVSPHFPPVNAADMHRVRISAAHFRTFGWNPVVLAVAPEYVEGVQEPLLLQTLGPDAAVVRVRAVPARCTRPFGIGNLGLRALPFLYAAGCRLIREHAADLVYFSTTMFPVVPLGRLWKRRLGVPFVVDMQDPWLSDYHRDRPDAVKPPKYRAALRMHAWLEPWTMPEAGGLIAVSADYIDTLRRRYPALENVPAAVLPFGAAPADFEVVRRQPQPNRFFQPDGSLHGVYVGRGGADMAPALRILFGAFQAGLREQPRLFSKVRLHFIGTDYAPAGRARKTILPVAEEFGLARFVAEHPARIPYFEGLQLLLDSDFLIVPGSDDPQYTASKIYPYILARKPLVAVFHRRSSVCGVLRQTGAAQPVAFDPANAAEAYSAQLLGLWTDLLERLPFVPRVDWDAFAPYSAVETARRQCALFSQVLGEPVRRPECTAAGSLR